MNEAKRTEDYELKRSAEKALRFVNYTNFLALVNFSNFLTVKHDTSDSLLVFIGKGNNHNLI